MGLTEHSFLERMELMGLTESRVVTNADRIRSMTDEEIAEWYWWMLRYVQGYTDSRLALSEWLKEEFKDGSS